MKISLGRARGSKKPWARMWAKGRAPSRQSSNGSENWPKPSSPFATAKRDLTPSLSPPPSLPFPPLPFPARVSESHLYPGEGDGKEGRKQASKQASKKGGEGEIYQDCIPTIGHLPLLAVAQGVGSWTRGVTRLWLR